MNMLFTLDVQEIFVPSFGLIVIVIERDLRLLSVSARDEIPDSLAVACLD